MLQPAFYKAVYTVLAFLANLLLANILLPSNFGNVSMMIVNAAIIYLITSFGADSIIMHSLNTGKWQLPQAFSFTIYTSTIQIIFFLLLELAHIRLWGSTLLAQNSLSYLICELLYFIGLILLEKYIMLLYSRNKATVANQALVITVLFYLATLLLVKVYQLASFFVLYYIFCLQSFLQGCALLMLFHWHEKMPGISKIKWLNLYDLFKVSAVVMLTNFIQLLAYRIDFLLINMFYTDHAVGIYAQVNKFANLMWVIPNIFAFLLIPKFRSIHTDKLPLVFRYAMISGAGLLVATIVVTQVFFSFFINEAYQTGLPSFYLMLPGYFCWSVVIYFGAYFSWRGRFYNNLIISTFCFFIVLLCDVLLIPEFSINGAAVANTIAYSVTLLLCFILFSKETGIGFLEIVRSQKTDFASFIKMIK